MLLWSAIILTPVAFAGAGACLFLIGYRSGQRYGILIGIGRGIEAFIMSLPVQKVRRFDAEGKHTKTILAKVIEIGPRTGRPLTPWLD